MRNVDTNIMDKRNSGISWEEKFWNFLRCNNARNAKYSRNAKYTRDARFINWLKINGSMFIGSKNIGS